MALSKWDAAPFLEKVVGVVPGVIYVFNQKTQSNEYSNDGLSDILGFTSDEIRDMGDALFPTLCHPDDLPQIGAYFGMLQGLADGEQASIEYRMRHKSGHWVWLLSNDTVFERDEDGAILRHIGVATDISMQKQGEAEVAAAKAELETIFNAASSGIIAFDAQGQVVRINARARHMLGGLLAEPPFAWPEAIRFLDPETMQPLIASADPLQRALAGHALQGETHLLRRIERDDDARYVRVASAAAGDVSGVHLVLVLDDVSNEERNRQVIERKSRLDALGQLTGGIAHDFNNLLASLLYAVDLASRTQDPVRRQDYFETASTTIQRGSALTARLLAFARRQPGLATSRDIASIFSDFEKLVRPMLEAQIEIGLDIEGADTLLVFCDQTQLETSLMNLVLNARDAMLRGGRGHRIDIRARAVRNVNSTLDDRQHGDEGAAGDSFRYVEISVTDNGPGMDEETLARSTDPFFTTKDSNSGTGLGLAIVYGFITQSDGDLRLYSEEGVGTTIAMTLPRGTAQDTREAAQPQETIPRGSGQTVLLVEDEHMLAVMMTDVLSDLGYRVVAAKSGQEALDIVADGQVFDVLLSDVVMPGPVGGFELARRLRAERPDLPVIYTSGYTGFTASEMGEVQAPLLQKPTPPEILAEAIARAIGARG